MPQAPGATTDEEIADVADSARRAVKRLRNASRDADRELARLDEALEEHGIQIGVKDDNHGPDRGEGD